MEAEGHGHVHVARKLVAIACSTGGPKALHSVIPRLPANLNAPVVIVQHMPKGFTQSLAERLDMVSPLVVKEAAEQDLIKNGQAYIARAGSHLKIRKHGDRAGFEYSDEPLREGVKPCANYMFESIVDTPFDEIICVVMTGMGADGMEGIANLKKQSRRKRIRVIAQSADTCVVFGMPRAVINAKLADKIVPLEEIANEIITNVGVK